MCVSAWISAAPAPSVIGTVDTEVSEPAVDPTPEHAAPTAAPPPEAAVPGGCSDEDTGDEDDGGELFIPPALGSESDEQEPDPGTHDGSPLTRHWWSWWEFKFVSSQH